MMLDTVSTLKTLTVEDDENTCADTAEMWLNCYLVYNNREAVQVCTPTSQVSRNRVKHVTVTNYCKFCFFSTPFSYTISFHVISVLKKLACHWVSFHSGESVKIQYGQILSTPENLALTISVAICSWYTGIEWMGLHWITSTLLYFTARHYCKKLLSAKKSWITNQRA